MVSRRRFFSIFIMMAVLLFMFQFSEIIKENGNNYDKNEYAAGDYSSKDKGWTQEDTSSTGLKGDLDGTDDILYVGKKDTGIYDVVSQWCMYTKRYFSHKETFDIPAEGVDIVVLDTSVIDVEKEFSNIVDVLANGINIIFCGLPDVEIIRKNNDLRELFGINAVKNANVKITGVHLYKDFLLGGEAVYKAKNEKDEKEFQDLQMEIPWLTLGPATKAYMTGILDDKRFDSEDYPRILWRNCYHGTMMFVVNGNYMNDLTGLGILNGFIYEMQDYQVYPVVNAQNTLVVDYPNLSNENAEKINELYSRTPQALFMDIMWPGILSMATKDDLKLTCYINTKYNYDNGAPVDENNLIFYLQQFKEADAEAGKSLNFAGNITIEEKIKADNEFYHKVKLKYEFGSIFIDNISDAPEKLFKEGDELYENWSISSLNTGDYPLLGYYGDKAVLQSVTNIADEYTFSKDLKARSLASALGYSNTMISIGNVLWPQTEDDQWENYFEKVFSNVTTYWTGFDYFDITTASESDKRVRGLLNVEYDSVRTKEGITINLKEPTDVWFVLRTHGEQISDIDGGTYEMIEEDAYLIHTSEDCIKIKLGKSEGVLEYKGPFGN